MKILLIYLVYWTILSEKLTLEHIAIGSIVCLAIFIFNKKTSFNNRLEKLLHLKSIKYWAIFVVLLIKEIFKSNLNVAKIVLSPKLNISPSLIYINTNIKSDLYKSILANSITLTPGTLTINLNDDELLIHCLQKDSSLSLNNNVLEKIIMKAEDVQ